MPFRIVRNDITKMAVDAIVNTANPKPVVGSGVDYGIHQAAGPDLLAERKKIGDIAVGDAVLTDGFHLPAKYVIHTSGPVWDGGDKGEIEALTSCYEKSLALALKHNCTSIAFPLISSGNYGFPKGIALKTAITAMSGFLMEQEMDIYLVVFDKESFALSENMIDDVRSYVDEHYVEEVCEKEIVPRAEYRSRRFDVKREDARYTANLLMEEDVYCAPCSGAGMRSLEDLLAEVDDSFSKHLLRLIDERGLTDPQVYKKANIDRKLFSKIKNHEDYKPSKKTVLALALALELSLDETKDLLGRAGYALSKSNKFDLIVEYYIINGNYNIIDLNIMLYELIQDTISS